ncbi:MULTISPECIES: PQQ-dependent dehydrogenase, methanol/ethanol family [unclassified Acidocella]|uniref:PQQ-dependent dehydrogenase, methanol/ethanol family n=1 Tax=unclassified Acidocella TaxID=2648610 RepID=UPI00028C8BD9|nr:MULTISPECIES: PQQ-dependent dehydrogenase, methanol/ethanol family [unclassified Acidocella]EKM98938.1 putative quinoprotein ethanol dehydrogenase [Acidocella sp. MX-AZ02]WBO58640.1 PQQ-dependent dehydrogenase, methanol/ethanol family [Acidocella sp. MX-AZ03]
MSVSKYSRLAQRLLTGVSFTLAAGLLAAPMARADQAAYQPVTSDMLANAASNDGWLMFNHDYTGQNFSQLKQIDTKNAGKLTEAWTSDKIDIPDAFEGSPVINGDYMFVTTAKDHVIAYNATTGQKLWEYDYQLPTAAFKTLCCDTNNRGVALSGDMVIFGTLDNHVVALDAATGAVKWNVTLKEPGTGYSITEAPLIVNGKVIIGTGGGEYGARGRIVALDVNTGNELWKFYTTPSEDEPGGKTWPAGAYKTGGGSPWMTGTYDPSTDTLFWGVGNPGPWLATMRPGDNLYTDSLVALDPNTGKLKWYYQFTPNDTWDYDGVNTPVLTDLTYKGKQYQAVIQPNRNGYLYALDRTTGKFIYAVPFVHDTSVTGIKNGVTQTSQALRPALGKTITTCPSFLGGKNWWPIAVDPMNHTAYITTLHACMSMTGVPVTYAAGLPFLGETFKMLPDPKDPNLGSFQAINLNTGKQMWQHETKQVWDAGALSTAGGVVFSGTVDGKLHAFDAKTGKDLWTSPAMGTAILADPVAYSVNGTEYVAVWASYGGVWPLWGGALAEPLKNTPRFGQLHVYKIGS